MGLPPPEQKYWVHPGERRQYGGWDQAGSEWSKVKKEGGWECTFKTGKKKWWSGKRSGGEF